MADHLRLNGLESSLWVTNTQVGVVGLEKLKNMIKCLFQAIVHHLYFIALQTLCAKSFNSTLFVKNNLYV